MADNTQPQFVNLFGPGPYAANAPTSSSGVLGTVPGTTGANQNAPQLPEVNDFVSKLLAGKQHEQQKAVQDLGNMFQLHKMGFPVNFDAFRKLVNRTDMKDVLATTPQQLRRSLAANAAVPPEQTGTGRQQTPFGQSMQGQSSPFGQQTTLPQNPFQRNPDGTITAQPGAPEHVQEAVSLHNDLATGKADPKTVPARQRSMFIKSIAHAAKQIVTGIGSAAKTWGQTQTALEKAQLQEARSLQDIDQKKQFILDHPDSPLAAKYAGALMTIGNIPWNFDKVRWDASDAAGKANAVRVWQGGRTDQDIFQAQTRLADTLISTHQVANAGDAMNIAGKWARGESLSPDDQKQLRPDFTRQIEARQEAMMLTQYGLPPEQMETAAQMIESGQDPFSLIPPGAQTDARQKVQAELEEIHARTAQYEAERTHWEATAKALQSSYDSKETTALATQTRADIGLYNALSKQKNVNPEVQMAILQQVADDMNRQAGKKVMTVERLRSFWDAITGGEGTPTLTGVPPSLSDQTGTNIDELTKPTVSGAPTPPQWTPPPGQGTVEQTPGGPVVNLGGMTPPSQ